MQTWITDKDFYDSATNLKRHHLQANIYESIQILASLLDCNDKLVNPKKSVKNYPQSKLWVGYEVELFHYIIIHLDEWTKNRKYKSVINMRNISMISNIIDINKFIDQLSIHHSIWRPNWITDELIQTHRSVLIQKEIEKEKELKSKYSEYKIYESKAYRSSMDDVANKFKLIANNTRQKIKNNYYYRGLWPKCPTNLSMRYDWRNK